MPRRLSFASLALPAQPLLALTLAYIAGLLIAARWTLAPPIWLAALFGVWVLCALLDWFVPGRSVTACLWLGFLCAGGASWSLQESALDPINLRQRLTRGELQVSEPVALIGTLQFAPELAPDRVYLQLATERASSFGKEWPTNGAVQLVVPLRDDAARADYAALQLRYGIRLRVLAWLNTGKGYGNPGAPKFDELLEFRGFAARGWVKSPLLIEVLGRGEQRRVLAWLYDLRAQALAAILQHCQQPAAGILAASLLGNRYFLDRRAAQSFRAGGTFHLLVISGAHVALIAAALWWLTQRWHRERGTRLLLVLGVLWAYALMIGAQPAITRAVVMVSVALIGDFFFRKVTGVNALACAALVLLLWQPRELFNPAFQLTFLTVAVIVLMAAPLLERMQAIGHWRPAALTPYPPRTGAPVRTLAEALFWDERAFQQRMRVASLRYRLEKAPLARWLNRYWLQAPLRWIALTLLTTVCVQVALLPLMIVHFHRASLIAPLTNLIEGMLIAMLMAVGVAQLGLHTLSALLAGLLSPLANGLGRVMVWTSEQSLRLPLASVRVPDWANALGVRAAFVYGLFFALVLMLVGLIHAWQPLRKATRRRDRQQRRLWWAAGIVIAALLCLSVVLIVHPFSHQFTRGQLQVTFLDVGQGDAMLLRFPHGRTLLLDSGGRLGYALELDDASEDVFIEDRIGMAEAAVLPYLWHLGLQRLDYLAATHSDSDHTEGFGEIVANMVSGEAWVSSAMTGELATQATALTAIAEQAVADRKTDFYGQAIRAQRLPWRTVLAGEVMEIDGVKIEVLAPLGVLPSSPSSLPSSASSSSLSAAGMLRGSDNNASLVLRVTFGERAFLFTGDIERETELQLVARGAPLRADVLKVPHHGSRTSSTAQLLAQVQPRHAIISAADPSPFGHPHPEVVARLQASGAHVWRTSACGAITISTDGVALQVETFIPCAPAAQSGDSVSRSFRESR